jgi:Ca2+-transporting ATPase
MPHTTTIPDLLESLGTDPTAGLSPGEAAKRGESRTAVSLFRSPACRYAECVKKTIREPALWLLTAVALISLFFDRIALGIVCLLLTVGNVALCAYFLYRADRTDRAMLAYDAPLTRVLRGGRVLRMSADGLVPGDIILLRRGDIVPADCRLLRTDGFAVMERELDAADPLRAPIRLDKNADVCPADGEGRRHSPVNMAFAGGLV